MWCHRRTMARNWVWCWITRVLTICMEDFVYLLFAKTDKSHFAYYSSIYRSKSQIGLFIVAQSKFYSLYQRNGINLVLVSGPLINNTIVSLISFNTELPVMVYSKGKSTYCLVAIFCSVDNVAYHPLIPVRGLQ
jgi:hypothetical protein